MKKHILLFIILLLSVTQTKAQTSVYHPFPDSNAVWNENAFFYDGCGYPADDINENYSYIINGDTTINTYQYHKVYIPYVNFSSGCGSWHSAGYAACIRQDTTKRMVYTIYPGNGNKEAVLYNFNLQVGDAIPQLYCNDIITITKVDSILIGASYRKQWEFIYPGYPLDSGFIIEGIGFTGDLFGNPCIVFYEDGYVSYLDCFNQKGVTLYPDSTFACNVIEAVNNIPIEEISLQLFPNPATNQLTIRTSLKEEHATVSIMNVLGQEAIQSSPSADGFNLQSTIDVSSLSSGIYFLQLKTGCGNVVKKFVKQ